MNNIIYSFKSSFIYIAFVNIPEESELSTDDIFWSKHDEEQQQLQAAIYPSLPKLTSPPSQQQQKTLTPTPATPIQQAATPNSLVKSSPSSIGTLRSRAHNFISRNILNTLDTKKYFILPSSVMIRKCTKQS